MRNMMIDLLMLGNHLLDKVYNYLNQMMNMNQLNKQYKLLFHQLNKYQLNMYYILHLHILYLRDNLHILQLF